MNQEISEASELASDGVRQTTTTRTTETQERRLVVGAALGGKIVMMDMGNRNCVHLSPAEARHLAKLLLKAAGGK